MDAVANRVRRVATGWETQLSIAVDGVISRLTMFELCEAFYALAPQPTASRTGKSAEADITFTRDGPGTRLRLRTEVMAGTWEALSSGQADLAIGVAADRTAPSGIEVKAMGTMAFVFAVAPHHPLATADAPISDLELMRHRAVAVADSAQRLAPLTVNLLPGQDVLTVSSMQLKIEAQLRCMGCGFVPEPLVREHIAAGRLVVKPVQRVAQLPSLGYAWRTPSSDSPGAGRKPQLGLALRWWLTQLESATTRVALIERHSQTPLAGM
jgi:DNA-binding transcriptional LysR family regulator